VLTVLQPALPANAATDRHRFCLSEECLPRASPFALSRPGASAMKRWVTDLWLHEDSSANPEWAFVASVLVLGAAAGLLIIRSVLAGQ
jgi:hypothetical protein